MDTGDININVDFENKDGVKNGLILFSKEMEKYYSYEYYKEEDAVHILNKEAFITKTQFEEYFTCANIFAEGERICIEEFETTDWGYLILSQVYLFEKALAYGLENDIVSLCESLLDHIKEINNFFDIWHADVAFFGYHLLFTLAYFNPKYTYMMSEYFTSGWDDQSVTVHHYFYLLYEKYGLHEGILNAISYLSYGERLYDQCGFLNPTCDFKLGEDGKYIYKDSKRFYNEILTDEALYERLKALIIKNATQYKGEFSDHDDIHVVQKYFSALAAVNYYNEEAIEQFQLELIHGKTIDSEIDFIIDKIDAQSKSQPQPVKRLEDAEPKHIITYKKANPESIKSALKQYAQFVNQNIAFENRYCVVLADPEGKELSLSFFKENPPLYEQIKSFVSSQIENDDANILGYILSETVLFACALRFPELEEIVKETLEVFVSYARDINDSSEMWITCEKPFAIEPLLLVANLLPQYGYLLASFMVPYWDDEHMPEPLTSLASWSRNLGITDDTLKAFCYCDNNDARSFMGDEGNFKILSYLRESEENYLKFKNILLNRFKEMTYLITPGASAAIPVTDFVYTLMLCEYPCDRWDDDFDMDEFFTQTFVNKAADIEIPELQSFITDTLGHPIIAESHTRRSSTAKQPILAKEEPSPLDDWELFITKSLDEGKTVWEYIKEGSNPSILENIPETNLYLKSKKINYKLYKLFSEDCYDNSSLWNDFDEILKPLYLEFKKWAAHNDIAYQVYDQIILRLLDVIFVMYGRKPFPEKIKNLVTHKYEICKGEEFLERYKTDWFSNLESTIEKFGSRRDSVFREYIDSVWDIISSNRLKATKLLPNTLFAIDDQKQSTEELIKAKYGSCEIMIVAALIAYKDQQNEYSDQLTQSALSYLECHNKLALWNDLLGDLDIPERYIIELIEKGDVNRLPKETIDDYHNKKDDIELLNEYVSNNGFICQNGETLSPLASEKIIKTILNRTIKCEKDEVSAKQKNIDWLRGFSEKTQKLLYVAHLAQKINALQNNVISNFILKYAFEIAPVRTTHLLAKVYKKEKYIIDRPDQIFNTLDKFVSQGLSKKGYWAYVLHEFQDNYGCRGFEEGFYKELLKEWIKSNNKLSPDSSLPLFGNLQEQDKIALVEGYDLISRRAQQEILQHSTELGLELNGVELNDKALLDVMKRKLHERFSILNFNEYFKNRLIYEGHFVEFVEWSEWTDSPELMNQVLHKIQVDQPQKVTLENCEEKLMNKGDWGYLILQKQGDEFIPLIGKDLMWMIQKSCNEQDLKKAQCHGIFIDETCPKENINELMKLSQLENYTEVSISKCLGFLKGEVPYDDAALLMKHGIRDYNFIDRYIVTNYNDTCINTIIPHLSEPLQKRLFQMFALISHEILAGLESSLDLSDSKYFDLLLKYTVDNQSALKYFISKGKFNSAQSLARQVDVSGFLPSLKIKELFTALAILAHLPYYHSLIISFKEHESSKIKNQVEALIDKYHITGLPNKAYKIVDFGEYKMRGSTESQTGTNRKTARIPVCSHQSETIKAELGQFIGFRFIAAETDKREVLHHHVVVKHPVQDVVRGTDYLITQWKQNGYSNSEIFLGWHFETPEELISGEYHFEAYDMDWKLIVKKTINVE
jgi:hypothetical protein